MAIIESAASGNITNVGSDPAKGLHTIAKPQDADTLGHYALAVQTGNMAAGLAANAEIFQFRWIDATRLALINKVICLGWRAGTAFTAGNADFKLTTARNWTADGSGGTSVLPTGEINQLRTSMGASLLGSARIASTAALVAGTKTLDTADLGQIVTHTSGGTASATPIIGAQHLPYTDLFNADIASGEHPIILAQNEGIVIRASVPATGVWNIGFLIKWAEVNTF